MWNVTAVRTLTCKHSLNNSFTKIKFNAEETIYCKLVSENFIGNINNNTTVKNLVKSEIEERIDPEYGTSVPYNYRIVLFDKNRQIPLTINWEENNSIVDNYRYSIIDKENSSNLRQKVDNKNSTEILTIINYILIQLKLSKRMYITKYEAINIINDYIKKPTDNSLILEDNLLLGAYITFGICILLAVVSILIFLLSPKTSYTFNLQENVFTVQYWRFGQEKIDQYSIIDVLDIQLEEKDSIQRNRIILNLCSDEKILLTSYYDSTFEARQQIVQKIKTFLETNFQNNVA
ncbi:MAG: hypothetical protein AAFQ80_13185 [Cyanobacteria bacterium J06621_8]